MGYRLERVLNVDENFELKRLGKFFKDFRTGRDLTLKEAAGEDWSATTLSRFENGVSDISNEKATGLIRRIGIQPKISYCILKLRELFPCTYKRLFK